MSIVFHVEVNSENSKLGSWCSAHTNSASCIGFERKSILIWNLLLISHVLFVSSSRAPPIPVFKLKIWNKQWQHTDDEYKETGFKLNHSVSPYDHLEVICASHLKVRQHMNCEDDLFFS